jgi:transcriptional regulator GlxA family with amidase domain
MPPVRSWRFHIRESSEVAPSSILQRPQTQTRRILLIASPGTQILDVTGPFQVFTRAGELFARQHAGLPPIYSVQLVSTSRKNKLVTSCGLYIEAHRHFRVAGGGEVENDETKEDIVQWIGQVAPRVRRLGSVCTGAMLLARAGLLAGRTATTHCKWSGRLASKYPRIQVDSNPIFVRDGNVYTSAGVTVGMDLALALVEEDHGSQLALAVAREPVLYLRRSGGQSQFSNVLSLQFTWRKPLRELGAWVLDNLHRPLSVELLADHLGMSPRHFARTFTEQMQVTPARFVEQVRLETARRRLEESERSMEQIADECGFSSVNTVRAVFQRVLGVPPGEYRQHFSGSPRRSNESTARPNRSKRQGRTNESLQRRNSCLL